MTAQNLPSDISLKDAMAFSISEWHSAGVGEEELLKDIMKLIDIHGYKQVLEKPDIKGILQSYEIAMGENYNNTLDLKVVIHDILKYLATP